MPKVPRYDVTGGAGLTRQYTANIRPLGLLAQAEVGREYARLGETVQRAGSEVTKVGLQIQQQTDSINAFRAYNSLRDEARQMMTDLQQRKGEDPGKLSEEYVDWYEEAFQRYNKELTGGAQRQLWERAMNSRRSDLDILANYESREHKRQLEEMEATSLATGEQEIRRQARAGALNAIEDTLTQIENDLYASNPGELVKSKMLNYEAKLRAAAANEMMMATPSVALAWIEKHKDALGAGYQKLKADAQEQVLVSLAKPFIQQGQYDQALRAIENAKDAEGNDIPPSVKAAASSYVRTQRYEDKYRENETKRQNLEATEEDFYGAMNLGSVQLGRAVLDKALSQGLIDNKQYYSMGRVMETAANERTDQGLEKEIIVKVMAGQIRSMDTVVSNPDWLRRLNTSSVLRIRSAILQEMRDPSHYSQPINLALQTWDRKYKGTDYDAMKQDFYNMLHGEIQKGETEKGRKLTYEEVSAIGNRLLQDHDVQAQIWGIKIPFMGGQSTLFEERMRQQTGEGEHRLPGQELGMSRQRGAQPEATQDMPSITVEGIPQAALMQIYQEFQRKSGETGRQIPFTDATVRTFWEANKERLMDRVTKQESESTVPVMP